LIDLPQQLQCRVITGKGLLSLSNGFVGGPSIHGPQSPEERNHVTRGPRRIQ
jgi:hypothetical protein